MRRNGRVAEPGGRLGRAGGRQAGVSYLEVLVAVALLLVVGLPVGHFVVAASGASHRAAAHTRALYAAQAALETARRDWKENRLALGQTTQQVPGSENLPAITVTTTVSDAGNPVATARIIVTATWQVGGAATSLTLETLAARGVGP